MTELDDDIARIAALRGRKAEDYAPEAVAQRRRVVPTARAIAALFHPTESERNNLDLTDALPEASRLFLRECPLVLNTDIWANALEAGVTEADLIKAAQAEAERRLGQPLETFRRRRRRRLS